MLHVLPRLQSELNIVSGRFEEGHDLDWFMADFWMACDEDLPDCRRQLLQTVKECFRQIFQSKFLQLRLRWPHGFGTSLIYLAWDKPKIVLAWGRCHS